MVIRTSQLIPEMQEAFFQCQVCAYSTRVEVDRGRIAEPAVCRHCNNTHSLALVHNRSVFSDKQMVRAGRRSGGRASEQIVGVESLSGICQVGITHISPHHLLRFLRPVSGGR